MLRILLILVMSLPAFSQENFPSKKDILIFADIIDQHLMNAKNKLRRNDARVLEFLLYKDRFIQESLKSQTQFYKKFVAQRRLTINTEDKTITYLRGAKGRILSVKAQYSNSDVSWIVTGKKLSDQGQLNKEQLAEKYYQAVKTKIYDQVQMRKGYSDFQAQQNYALNAKGDIKLENINGKTKLIRIKEKIIRNNKFDNSEWKYVPVKLISYPAQKIMYEIPGMITGLATESVTRSPKHNFQGAVDEAAGAGKSFYNGFVDLFRGILRPKKANSIDGLLTIADGGFKIVKTGLGVVKTVVSFVGYPLYRLFGGKKSRRVALKGKRAAIVLIDTGMDGGRAFDQIIDTYGETIVRNQLKSISNYYCVTSNAEDNNITDCIDQMPDSIEYVDFFGLTHSGADYQMEQYAKYAADTKGVKPELIVSIGCYDDPSTIVEKENTTGQKKTSWAVHYYLSNLIAKRLRGIPMEVAANEAFYGAIPANIVNPISLGAVAAIGFGMEDKLIDGYWGSKPDLMTDDNIAKTVIHKAWARVKSNSNNISRTIQYKDLDESFNMLYKKVDIEEALAENREILRKAHELLDQHKSKFSKDLVNFIENSKEFEAELFKVSDLKNLEEYIENNYQKTLNKDIPSDLQVSLYYL